ncbi:MAG: DNA polymerase III, subunit gamma and tau [Candidatus Woykebacteria bacterium RBG_13_40_15]|uniref:DNA polymerase III subunit gamma/tau n=1 Tax=Candidatus Woykebacteria bacterium RBG_13_40_15 TaxID=1802593 RepID=A0A1G1W639_9BACT|nr:MAG: DNA polymerase III, subunit gamma and tau [Candidatus Woykebacteria bacterium RBG_13_40_15]
MVLYRKYRPQALSEVVGQEQIRDQLLAQLKSGKISHAYLFSGSRGTGKTSVARIVAKAVNCSTYTGNVFGEPCNKCEVCVSVTDGSNLDLIEIDAASNRGIDEIRELREKIKLAPAGGKFKVYIIDEAHMLTGEAFNALLKTLEEPPAHAIFILATTEPHKIPATIASRVTKFDFKMPDVSQIKEKLTSIVKKEAWGISADSLEEIAKMAAGAFRDAEVLLEKVVSVDTKADLEKTLSILGKKETASSISLLDLLEKGMAKESLIWLDSYLKEGGNVRILTESVLEILRKIILVKAGAGVVLEPIAKEELEALVELNKKLPKERLLKLTDLFNKSIEQLRDSTIPQLPLEIAIVEGSLDKMGEAIVEEDKDIANVTEEPKEEEPAVVKAETEKEPAREAVAKEIEKENPSKPNPSEGKILKKLHDNWSKMLKAAKEKSSSLGIFLSSAKVKNVDEDLLILEFGYRFHKEKAEEKKYKEMFEDVLEEVIGAKLRVKCVVGERPPEPKKEEKEKLATEADPVEIFSKLE